MNKEIESLKKELEDLKKERENLELKNELKQKIVSLKKGFNPWPRFNFFQDINVKENLKEIWGPIRSYIINAKRLERKQEQRGANYYIRGLLNK